jgi:hypothetical protein
VNGTGTASQVGSYTHAEQECVDFGGYPFSVAGSFAITAADGDTVVGTHTGTATLADDGVTILYDHKATVTGGTGRFAEVTGQLEVTGIAYPRERTSRMWRGTISSVGASKR